MTAAGEAVSLEPSAEVPRTVRGGAALWFGLAIVGVAMVAALGADLLATHDPYAQNIFRRNAPPSADHWFGLDVLGRDIYSRLLAGTRLSLSIAVAATLLAFTLGAGLGLFAVTIGGVAEWLVFGAIDLVRAMPGLLLALTLMVALGVGTSSVILALGISFSPFFAYVARATWRREMAAGYVAAARVLGASEWRILGRHVLPNIGGALITQAAIVLPRAITLESVLSFFGLGVSPDMPTWGRLIAAATRYVEAAPHAVAIPVAALALVTVGLSLLGDRLRLRYDPMRRGQPS